MKKNFYEDFKETNGKITASCSQLFKFDLKQFFTDDDGDKLEFTIARFNGSALPRWLGVSSDYVLSGTPTDTDGEVLSMSVVVTDNRGSTLSKPLEIVVGCYPKDMGRIGSKMYMTASQEFMYNF